jgi:hypothetical protein
MKQSTLWKYCAFCILTVCLLLPTSNGTQAQTTKKPPKALWILQEEIQPGQTANFKALQASLVDLYARANFPYSWVGSIEEGEKSAKATFYMELKSLNAMDDINSEFIVAHHHEEQIEPLSLEAEKLLGAQTEAFASFRPELSIETSETAGGVFRSGFAQIVKVQVKADQAQRWAGAVAEATSALRKAGSAKGVLTYEIISGDAPGTFLFIYPSNSADETSAARDNQQASIRALGGDVVVQEQKTLFSADSKLSFPGQGK